MSNWICDKCGATYIDVSHQEPSVLKQELEIRQLKELLKECRHIMSIEKDFASCHFEKAKLGELLTQIDEVLK